MAKLARLPRLERAARREPAHGRAPRLRTRYYAFLSYSHKDKELADWLHRELEKFRVPKALAGKLSANGVVPRRLTPIFRDQHDLSAGDDLAVEIEAALAASQFLVVLCSPTAATSRWTNLEIESFKRTRPEGCVLAAVLAGEPFASDMPGREKEECFPPALRFKYDRRGHRTAKRAEPLAADFRDGGEGKRIAFLKLVAGMLGIGLDELVQRETVRRHRQLAFVAAASLAGMAVTSTLAVTAIQARDEAREQRKQAEGLVGFMLGDLKDKLEPIGRLDALDAVGSRALAYYQHQDKGSLSDEALAQRAKALTLIGEIANARGDLAGALSRYQEALASTGEAVRRYPDDPQRLFDHAQNVFWVGYIAYQRGQLGPAAARFREYERLADRMVALAPDKKEYRLEQDYANTNLGTVLMAQHRYREAAATYGTTLGLAEALAASEPANRDYQKQVNDTLAWLADAQEASGALEESLATRERQQRILADLERADPRDTEVQRDLMTSRRAVGRLLASRGEIAAGLEHATAAARIGDALFRIEPENTEWLQAIAAARFDLADLQLAANQATEAATTTRASCDLVRRLVGRNREVVDWKSQFQSRCLRIRSRIALAGGDADQAFELARQSLAAAQMTPKPIERGILSFMALSAAGSALEAANRHDEAARWWAAAAQSIPRDIELAPNEEAALAALKLRLGDRAGAQQLISTLSTIGYRHPKYLAAINKRRG
ncbi:MAG TPA: toll/interleukin-1 receptor domain-containing protein [Sphingomicrobium sp.]|nr:toll/interleukin-1 receptor domain-containing protein [Sphingomicrobium sp.]